MLSVETALPDVEELHKLVEQGQEKGFLTYDEIVKSLEDVDLTKEQLEELVVYGLPDDTFSGFVSAVTRQTAADLQRAAARYIQPDKMAVVVVGDRTAIETAIRALNLGPVNIIQIDDLFR